MRTYQMCERCVMDTTDPHIIFDENGICNHCKDYFEKKENIVFKDEDGKRKLHEIVNKIKEDGKNKKYDCILGISGGTDSSYVAYLAKNFGLKVLLVSVDNSWNSEIAKQNIENIAQKTGFDLSTYKLDWHEFKDLQLAYLKASVVDIEMVTDHIIMATIYEIANKKGIKHILTGQNFVTESIMPKSWIHRKSDLRNLKAIHKRFGKVKLKTCPTMGLLKFSYYKFFKKIELFPLLNYLDYNKKEAKAILRKELGWQDYGAKHHESIFTKFYQAYILPTKFNIDKRKAHLSNLICSGQITREEALKELAKPPYEKHELERDKKLVLNKLGLSREEFEDLMKLPIKKHQEYGTDEWIYSLLMRVRRA